MNDQQKKEILGSENLEQYCTQRNCSECVLDDGGVYSYTCTDEFYAIKIKELQKGFRERLKELDK